MNSKTHLAMRWVDKEGIGRVGLFQSTSHYFPVEVLEKGIDIITFCSWEIVAHVRVFPHIQGQYDIKIGELTEVLFVDPGLDQLFGLPIVVEHSPTNTAGLRECSETIVPRINAAPLGDDVIFEVAVRKRLGSPFELTEVVFVVSHATELEPESSLHFGNGVGVVLWVIGKSCDLVANEIDVFHVAFVESKVEVDRLLADAVEGRDGELFWFVVHI